MKRCRHNSSQQCLDHLIQTTGVSPGNRRDTRDGKLAERPLLALTVPAVVSIGSWVIVHRLEPGTAWPAVLAVLAAVVSLIAVAIIEAAKTRRVSVVEKQETRRAELPYRVEHTLAKAEARNRERYAKAQTRRFFSLGTGETYKPDTPTDLQQVMETTRKRLPKDGAAAAHEPDAVIDRKPYSGLIGNGLPSSPEPSHHCG
jgi:hypothetical protein